ncbi:MAG: flagellar basal body rod protein FlgC [Oscillospiraceae bacterium]|jgi:flagellar basal-body rod protein FlgC|nr:flagellar basal body rod protein FlgC [Oscillospiraceae bacterium]MCI9393479.1 flagellar basal body rod protein FlgC [Oscillospiraceae bacterium]MCI9580078.1 flagellar basal body rod protein FlgC [Oscillospiraceae bacterium]
MAFLSSIDIVGSGITAQHLRLDVISENITNMNTTRTEAGGAYRRKVTVFQAESGKDSFRDKLAAAQGRKLVSNDGFARTAGVRVAGILEDQSDFKLKFDPTDPDANEDGYVELPNVDLVKEITDGMAASQAYNANVTAFNLMKNVISKGLEIGK